MIAAIIHGLTLSVGLILPLGAQNVFIFNQGASHRKWMYALPAVLTASVCDTLLIIFAVLGVSVVVLTMQWMKVMLFGFGFIFLLYMGWSIWNTETTNEKGKSFSGYRQISYALSVSLLNPHAILDTIGVIGTSSLSYDGTNRILFCIACISVSWIWFFSLSYIGHEIGSRDNHGKWIMRMNKLSALIIWGVAIYIGKELLKTS